jgi:uncharacterized protein YggT (Ycf19 family)
MNSFWTYWYFHIPNFILAAVMYTMLARLALGVFVPDDWDNYIWRFFKTITDPFARLVRLVTPQVISGPVILVFGVLWLMVLRVGYLVLLLNLGVAPVATSGS